MRFALVVVLLACGAGPPEAPEPVGPGSDESQGSETTTTMEREAPPRALGPTATFADLVAGARRLDDRGDGDATTGCILRGSGETGAAWRLEADLAVGVRPLPNPTGLATRLSGRGPVRVLTRWGQRGSGSTSFAAFTTLPPPASGHATLIAITDEGIHLRTTGDELPASDAGPHRLDRWEAALTRVLARAGADVYVAAEPGTSLGRLRQVLATLPRSVEGEVALAVILAEGVTLPDPPASDDERGLCPDGLPESTGAMGNLDAARIRAALAPLREAGAACMQRASPEAARGGRVQVAMRIAEGGTVSAACLTADQLGDPQLRRCVLNAVQGLSFPDPGGDVDVALPIVLAPDRSERQRALCP